MKLLTYDWIDFPQNESHADVTLLLMIFVLTFLFWMLTGLCMIKIVHILGSVKISRENRVYITGLHQTLYLLLLSPVVSVLLPSQIMLLSILFYLILVLVVTETLDIGN